MRESKRWREVQLKHYGPAVEGRTDPPRYKKFLEHIGSPPLKILDVGCAGGDITYDLKTRGYEVIGVDYPEVIEKTKVKYPDLMLFALDVNEGLRFSQLFFVPDWIYASEILEHITHDFDFLASCYVILKDGGKIFVTVPRVAEKWDGHLRFYPVESLKNLLWAAGFEIVEEDKDFSSTIVIGEKISNKSY
jgi:2-polyprenyl-3-methyl-5-hydroxy-6-metoxy-1,4-benzoquinol methylase